MSELPSVISDTIREQKMFHRGERILVAVSGGADSMVLLRLLHGLAPGRRWRLFVGHFNHQLRGRASDADQRFVERAARALKLPCHCGSGDVHAAARAAGQSIEMAARELRHRFLAETASKLGCRCVALAHHADDQIELFFLRLLRGAGAEGLGGMRWSSPSPADRRIRLARPLLDVRRAALRHFAQRARVRFREDASNASTEFLRNRIRLELLPLLRRRYQPALDEIVGRVMEILGCEAEVVTEAARTILRSKPRSLARWPVGLQRRLVQLQLQSRGMRAEFDLIEWLRLHPGRRISLNPRFAVASDLMGRLHFAVPRELTFDERKLPVALTGETGRLTFNGLKLRWRITTGRAFRSGGPSPGREVFDADQLGPRIRLRHWRPGDRFQPIGMKRAVKLQDWFTNHKIPAYWRRRLVVAENSTGVIFWVEGQRIAEVAKLRRGTKRRLIWRWQRG